MAAVDADISEDDEQETSAPEKKKRLAGKVIVLYVVLPALLLIGAGAGVYMSGILGGGESDEKKRECGAMHGSTMSAMTTPGGGCTKARRPQRSRPRPDRVLREG